MSEQPFTPNQIFNLSLSTIEQRMMDFYEETQDNATTIQLLLALRVRYQLGAEEFALVLKDLVKYLFTRTKVTKTMKKFIYFFQDYFETSEWKRINLRVFPVRNFIEKAKSLILSPLAKLLPIEVAAT
ncbi:hypothetical protein JZO70_20365 [Enterococcus sp. 669A]|uniref:Uncharacterized protein n=1 Tax=Candidatus Enterococcus moelleringii TaxID=2815325 RepID=A0ABS3LFY1_9ENTE|nr:hypothetical protein [Enterococcus sp. 669A]MBO1308540.1 hypothetical protein [Enterococcus sp. 669A]